MIFERARLERLFDFTYRIEIYTSRSRNAYTGITSTRFADEEVRRKG